MKNCLRQKGRREPSGETKEPGPCYRGRDNRRERERERERDKEIVTDKQSKSYGKRG